MQKAVLPNVARKQAVEHHKEAHTSKGKIVEQEESSGPLHATLMEQGQPDLDLKINKSECLFEARNCEDLHILEQVPTSGSDSSSSPRVEDLVEPE